MMNQDVIDRGLDSEALGRILFRLDFIEKSLLGRIRVLHAGNLASPYPELMQLANLSADLCNTLRELVMLTKVSQQEQGLATPPNTVATVAETPVTTPNPA